MNSRTGILASSEALGRPPQSWARAACWACLGCALPSATWRVAMMAGADVGFGYAYLYRGSAGGIVYVLALESVQVGAAIACVGLCRPWGERVPGWVPGLGGRTIPCRLPMVLGGIGNALLYLIVYSVAFRFARAALSDPPGWTPAQGMSPGQTWVLALCYAPMLLWPVALTVALIGYRRRRTARIS